MLNPLPSETDDVASSDAVPPHNIEAEQALLGAILFDNEVYNRVSSFLQADHFYDPVHARIYEVLGQLISQGRLADAITLKTHFDADEALAEIGGVNYLAFLASAARTVINAQEYARAVFDLNIRRGLINLGQDMAVRAQEGEIEDDPGDQISEAEQELYRLAESGKYGGGFKAFADALEEAVSMATAAHEREGRLAGVSTGFIDLDRQLGGLHASDLIILAARPSMGKTSLATNIAVNAAKAYKAERQDDGSMKTTAGGVVALFSLEMSAEQIATRIISEQSRVSSDRIRRGDINEDDFGQIYHAVQELRRLPIHIDDTGGLSIAQIAARARRLKRRNEGRLDLIIVDYLQLLSGSKRTGDNRVQEITEVSMGLKTLAKELNVPVVALSQLSRQVENREDKRPQLSDLRESGSIEQDADVVMFLFREDYYLARSEPKSKEGTEEYQQWMDEMNRVHGLAEVIIGKQRHGPIGTITLQYDENLTKFSNLARQEPEVDGF